MLGSRKPGETGDWKIRGVWELIPQPRLLQARRNYRKRIPRSADSSGRKKLGQKQRNTAPH